MSLFIKKYKTKYGKTYCSIVDGYRINGKVKQNVVKKYGYYEDMQEKHNNVDDFLNSELETLKKEFQNKITATFNLDEYNTFEDDTFNIGYVYLKKIFHELGIIDILKKKQYSTNIKFSLHKASELLTYSRIINPGSIKHTYEHKNQFFESYDFSLDDLYRSLTPMLSCKEDIFKSIWENTKDKYNRDASTSYYDCTNYYFEIEYDDEDIFKKDENGNLIKDKNGKPMLEKKGLRQKGPEKNHRQDPIVEMGLLMDKTGFPISYNIFSGKTSEKDTLLPEVKSLKRRHNIDKIVVVADRGLNDSDNMYKLSGLDLDKENRDGYVYGQSIRGADEEFKNWVLKSDYIIDEFKDEDENQIKFIHKSRIYPRTMYVVREDKGLTKKGNKKTSYKSRSKTDGVLLSKIR